MSDTTEPVATKDTVECFRKFSFRSETYPILGNGDFVYSIDAAEIAPQQVIEPFDFTEHIPFRPERNALSLFPKFYFHLKKLFSNQFHANEAYCRYGLSVPLFWHKEEYGSYSSFGESSEEKFCYTFQRLFFS